MNREVAVEIAQQAAAQYGRHHRYIGDTPASMFAPHAWVVEAILSAAKLGYEQGLQEGQYRGRGGSSLADLPD